MNITRFAAVVALTVGPGMALAQADRTASPAPNASDQALQSNRRQLGGTRTKPRRAGAGRGKSLGHK